MSKESASRLAVTERLAQPRSLISVESAEAIIKAARRCRDSSQSLCKYSPHCANIIALLTCTLQAVTDTNLFFWACRHGYNFVVTLPVGAANIDIRQRGYKGMVGDDNYLALKNAEGHYLLNGNYIVSAGERDIIVKNSLLRYSGTTGLSETIQAIKPIGEALTVEVLCAGQMTPPRIRYSFYLARQTKEEKILKKDGRVNSHNSVLAENSVKEKAGDGLKKSYIKDNPTHGKWISANWDKCSVTCGHGIQRRMVQCLRADGRPGLDCDPSQRPAATRFCGDPCPEWLIGQWSPCSRTCGKGFKRRPLNCRTESGHLLPRDHCTGLQKPQELDFCNLRPC